MIIQVELMACTCQNNWKIPRNLLLKIALETNKISNLTLDWLRANRSQVRKSESSKRMCKLTHSPLVTQYGNNGLGQHWPRFWLVSWWHKATTCSKIDLRLLAFIPDQFNRKIIKYTYQSGIWTKIFVRFLDICQGWMG